MLCSFFFSIYLVIYNPLLCYPPQSKSDFITQHHFINSENANKPLLTTISQGINIYIPNTKLLLVDILSHKLTRSQSYGGFGIQILANRQLEPS